MNKRKKKNSERADALRPSASTAHTGAQTPETTPALRHRSGMMSELNRAWGNFLLPYPWHLVAHLTFTDAPHPALAARRFGRWIATLEQHPGRRSRGPIIWARGAEYQRREALHFHALIARTAGIAPFAAIRFWERIGRGFARVFPYEPDRGGTYYISKGGDVEVSAAWFGDAQS